MIARIYTGRLSDFSGNHIVLLKDNLTHFYIFEGKVSKCRIRDCALFEYTIRKMAIYKTAE